MPKLTFRTFGGGGAPPPSAGAVIAASGSAVPPAIDRRGQRGFPPEASTRVLRAHDSDTSIQWTRVEVAQPTLLWAFRNDTLTTTSDLRFLRGQYSASNPFRAEAGNGEDVACFPCGELLSAYLWTAGEWWIRLVHGAAGLGTISVPFVQVPLIDPSVLAYHVFNRPATRAVNVRFGLAPAVDTKVLSVQEILGGIRAVQFDFIGANDLLAFEDPIMGGLTYASRNPADTVILLEGVTLPLSDVWCYNGAAGTHSVFRTTFSTS